MPPSEAQAWWADVQHVRESIERRRAVRDDWSASAHASSERRFVRAAPLEDSPADGRGHAGRATGGATTATGAAATRTATAGTTKPARAPTDTPTLASKTRDEATASAWASADAPSALTGPPARRTVQITGRTVAAPPLPRLVEVERRRPARRPVERVGRRPDRIALWAVLLGFFLILVAATSSHAATQPAHASGATAALHATAR
jgi:hypothetical protein